ncbi:MAG: Uma2 family endonuclease [Kofleriaceae bacterium]|nr:MAG: Uma2 family endonuclease [Kofleriaceae bacterium]MBZ0231000.1 Uma2 family endonuclease [Kofleriaceae bacterium]
MPDGDDEWYDRQVVSLPHPIPAGDYVPTADQRITLYNVPWTHFEVQLALKGDDPVPRVAYLDGVLELMTPSKGHERTKSYLGCLIEVFALERDITLSPYGGWLLKDAPDRAGVEPDECYIVGPDQDKDRPDLAIEVIWTSGTLDKLEIYRRLEVGEVWVWRDGVLSVHVLVQGRYESVGTSRVLPGLDLSLLCSFLDRPTATDAMRAFRDALRAATP